MTLPRKHRMTTRAFRQFLKKGKRMRGEVCSIQYGSIPAPASQVAIVVPVRTEPSAVKRNRIRRRISEAVAGLLPAFRMPLFLIIRVYRGGDTSVHVCQEELNAMLRKSGIISR